jgi:hypothetical protein
LVAALHVGLAHHLFVYRSREEEKGEWVIHASRLSGTALKQNRE